MKYLIKYFRSHDEKFSGIFDSCALSFQALERFLLTKDKCLIHANPDKIMLLKVDDDFAYRYLESMSKPVIPHFSGNTTLHKRHLKKINAVV